jgi:hypothetical protein
MWNVHFKGFFQCRLATDPDNFTDPRGQDGWTFAFDGEPDLDRVIRFQDPVAPRSLAPRAGVAVVDVNGDASHRLVGARVSLLENAKFEGRNGLIANAGNEPIAPFVFAIDKKPFRLTRRDDYVVTNVAQRKPHLGLGVTNLSPVEATAIGVQDPAAFRATRRTGVQTALAAETDPVKRKNLAARLDQLENFSGSGDIQLFSLTFKVPYKHQLRHTATVADPDGVLPGITTTTPWDIAYFMGAWDADALQAHVEGTVSIAGA